MKNFKGLLQEYCQKNGSNKLPNYISTERMHENKKQYKTTVEFYLSNDNIKKVSSDLWFSKKKDSEMKVAELAISDLSISLNKNNELFNPQKFDSYQIIEEESKCRINNWFSHHEDIIIQKFELRNKYLLLDNKSKTDFKKQLMFAFIHSSIKNVPLSLKLISDKLNIPEKNIENYERLETLGDAILGACITKILFLNNSNDITNLRSNLVNAQNLYKVSISLGLDTYMMHGCKLPLEFKRFDDLFESVLGVIYLFFDEEECLRIVNKLLIK